MYEYPDIILQMTTSDKINSLPLNDIMCNMFWDLSLQNKKKDRLLS